ncbi:MAG: hypothetical protein IE889_03075 [Campylobacterales bacterium]|nr:hypothetical protein [Campylobacterales bacterium]
MDKKIKRSVATLLAHIIKVDKRDINQAASLFCSLMGQDFGCDKEEALAFLKSVMEENYNLNEHIDIINAALQDDKLSKMHILEQLNHIIYSDTISEVDYKIFDEIKRKLFPEIK